MQPVNCVEAITLLNDGKSVRNINWGPHEYVKVAGDKIMRYNSDFFGQERPYSFSITTTNYFSEKMWELYTPLKDGIYTSRIEIDVPDSKLVGAFHFLLREGNWYRRVDARTWERITYPVSVTIDGDGAHLVFSRGFSIKIDCVDVGRYNPETLVMGLSCDISEDDDSDFDSDFDYYDEEDYDEEAGDEYDAEYDDEEDEEEDEPFETWH